MLRSFAAVPSGLFVVLSLLTTTVANAQTAWQQPPVANGQGLRSDAPIMFPNFFQRIADDFTLSSAQIVTGAEWWAGSENNFLENLDNFSGFLVSVYANGPNNLPIEPPLFSQNFDKAEVMIVPTCDSLLLGGTVYRFGVQFTVPMPLNAGIRYWFHVGARLITFNHDAMLWAESANGNSQYSADVAPNDGVWQGPISGVNLAFRLKIGTTPLCNPMDSNCDGQSDGRDINAFVQSVVAGAAGCSPCSGDFNGDGVVNQADVQAYVCSLVQG